MIDFESIDLDPEAILERLERLEDLGLRSRIFGPAVSQQLKLLDDLWQQCQERLGDRADCLQPRVEELRSLIAPLFPQPPPTQLSDKEQAAIRDQVESLCEELEDILYALTLGHG